MAKQYNYHPWAARTIPRKEKTRDLDLICLLSIVRGIERKIEISKTHVKHCTKPGPKSGPSSPELARKYPTTPAVDYPTIGEIKEAYPGEPSKAIILTFQAINQGYLERFQGGYRLTTEGKIYQNPADNSPITTKAQTNGFLTRMGSSCSSTRNAIRNGQARAGF